MKIGLAGNPIAHSLSPAIHNAAYQELGLDWEYALYPCATEADYINLVIGIRSGESDLKALNVTTPYKGRALLLCDDCDSSAAIIGGVNALAHTGPCNITGHNTDGPAMVHVLEAAGVDPQDARVVICGTGPVAAAAFLSLAAAGAASIGVLSRDVDKAKGFIRQFEVAYQQALSSQLPQGTAAAPDHSATANKMQVMANYRLAGDYQALTPETLPAALEQATVLIDATPLGMQPDDPAAVPVELLHSGLLVLDTVYGHGETAILAAARAVGAQAIDGLGMLIEQAALSIELWAQDLKAGNVNAPRATMREAALAEMESRSS
jgi:shikimate dehydrogenase